MHEELASTESAASACSDCARYRRAAEHFHSTLLSNEPLTDPADVLLDARLNEGDDSSIDERQGGAASLNLTFAQPYQRYTHRGGSGKPSCKQLTFRRSQCAAERWPSAAARDQHSTRGKRNYLRNNAIATSAARLCSGAAWEK